MLLSFIPQGDGFMTTSDSYDGYAYGIYGQHHDASGAAVKPEFLINPYTNDMQYEPSGAALSGGGFVVSWTSRYQEYRYDGGGDGNDVLRGRRNNDLLFGDLTISAVCCGTMITSDQGGNMLLWKMDVASITEADFISG